MSNNNAYHRESLASISQRRLSTVKSKSIYVLPNAFTAAALFSAFYGIIAAMNGDFYAAAIAVFFSMLFDGMDGRVARLTHTQSEFGVQMDSLADAVSFGVAPRPHRLRIHPQGARKARMGHRLHLLPVRHPSSCTLQLQRGRREQELLPGTSLSCRRRARLRLRLARRRRQAARMAPSYQSEIAAVVTLYAGLTMVSNAPFFSGKSYAVVRTIPFWFVVVFALLFIVISSNTSLSVFVLFCIYALSGFAYGFYCWWTGRPNPIQADIAAALAAEAEEQTAQH